MIVCMTNGKPHTICFTSEKNQIGFSRLLRVNVCNVPRLTKIMASRFADINSEEQFIEDQEDENKRKKTQQNVISDAEEQVKKGAKYIHW